MTRVEWDWEGDGDYDANTGTSLVAQHIYAEAGTFQATVRVYDSFNVSDTASQEITIVDSGTNEPPIAELAVEAGWAPPSTAFNFDASGSTDPDGSIVKYEFNWGEGGGWINNGNSPMASHAYGSPGLRVVQLRVTDNRGITATDSLEVKVYHEGEDNDVLAQANVLPGFNFTGWYGNAGHGGYNDDDQDWFSFTISTAGTYTFQMFHLDVDADLDMAIFKDLGGGTTEELDSATSTTDDESITIEFTETGTFYWQIYVYHYEEEPAYVANYELAAFFGAAPVASLTADPLEGDAPLSVNFDASGSTDDGAITLYEWDWEGDGTYETSTGSNPLSSHQFSTGGIYHPVVRVTDDEDLTATATVTITALGGPPTASFTAIPGSGARVLEVTMDAAASSGVINKYEWDFDGNGLVDLTRTSGTDIDQATAFYYTPGTYVVELTVTDAIDRTDSTTRTVTVSGGVDNESELNNDSLPENSAADAAVADPFPAFPFGNFFGHVGPKQTETTLGDHDDWYKFTLNQQREVSIAMEMFDQVCDIDMKIYAEGDYSTALGTGGSDTDDDELITVTLDPGTYYLRVYAFTGSPAMGGYQLSGTTN